MIIINIYLILLLISTIIYLIDPKRQAVLYCGIFAFYGDNKYFSRDKFNILGIFNDSRGGDACGIGSNNYLETFCGTHSKHFCNSIADFKELPTSNFYLGHTAMLINEGLPNYKVKSLKAKMTLSETTVGILGMAFKGESDDIRESLSYKLKKIMEVEANEVLCTDPFVKDDRLVSLEKVIKKSDVIIVATPHSEYKKLELKNKKIVDVWNILGNGGLI